MPREAYIDNGGPDDLSGEVTLRFLEATMAEANAILKTVRRNRHNQVALRFAAAYDCCQ